MGLLDTLQTVVQDEIGKQSSTVLGTVIAFYDGTCTVRTDEGTFENIKCANTPVLESPCLLIPVNDEYISIPLKIAGGGADVDIDTSFPSTPSDTHVPSTKLTKTELDKKINLSTTSGLVKNDGTIDTKSYQETLSSGVNIKTINNNSLLGSGNITIQGGGGSVIGTGSFSIDQDGHLIVELPDAVDNPYFIDNNGHLIYDTTNTHNGE